MESEAGQARGTWRGTEGAPGGHRGEQASPENIQVLLHCLFSASLVLLSLQTVGLNCRVPEQPSQGSFGNSFSLQPGTSRRCLSSAGRRMFLDLSPTLWDASKSLFQSGNVPLLLHTLPVEQPGLGTPSQPCGSIPAPCRGTRLLPGHPAPALGLQLLWLSRGSSAHRALQLQGLLQAWCSRLEIRKF